MELPKKTLKETIEEELSYNPVLKRSLLIGLAKDGVNVDARLDPSTIQIPRHGLEVINIHPKAHEIKHKMLSPVQIKLYLNLRQKYHVTEEGEFCKIIASVPILGLIDKEDFLNKPYRDEWDLRKDFVTPKLINEFVKKVVLFHHAVQTQNINDWAKYRKQKNVCKYWYSYAEHLYRYLSGLNLEWL